MYGDFGCKILATVIRNDKNVKGLKFGNNEHRIIQYADDTTFCIQDTSSIKHCLENIHKFSAIAEPKLNLRKSKGIWLGSLKDEGI